MLQVGMTYTVEQTVTPDMTAKAVGSGGLEVFGTPFMMAMMESAAMLCVQPELPEGKGHAAPADSGRPLMAWGNRPCFCGDSLLCRSGLPVSGIDFGTGRDMNLHCGATRPLCRERCVQRSLPCVGNSDRRTTYRLRPRAKYDRSLKFFLQKRIRNGVTPGWKSPRLSQGQRKGYSAD